MKNEYSCQRKNIIYKGTCIHNFFNIANGKKYFIYGDRHIVCCNSWGQIPLVKAGGCYQSTTAAMKFSSIG